MLAALGYAQGGVEARRMPGLHVIAWALVLALPVTLPATLLLWPADLAAVSPAAWAGFLYVALMSQLISFYFWNAGSALGGIARVSQVQLLQPFLNLAFAALLLAEPMELRTPAFAAVTVGTVWLGRRARVRSA